jgi:Ca-activated chloride channel family protein
MILTTLQDLDWRQPLWLLLALQPFLFILFRSLWQRTRLNMYADAALLPWVVTRRHNSLVQRVFSRDSAYLLSWFLFAITAAGPRLPVEIPGKADLNAVDIMIVVDISRSMSASDVKPSRIRRARLEIVELLQRSKTDRFGIILYSAHPHVYVPLTSDHAALAYYLQNLDQLVLPTAGSLPAEALELARNELAAVQRNRAILLVTDGDVSGLDTSQRKQLDTIVHDISKDGIPVYILGVGSVEGDAIPLADGNWLSRNGRPVISRLDESLLQSIADSTDGRFSLVYDDDSDWLRLYERGMAAIPGSLPDKADSARIIWQEFYPLTLLPAMFLLFISLLPYRLHIPWKSQPAALSIVVLLFISILSGKLSAADLEYQAYEAYSKQDYPTATKLYEQLSSYAGRLGEASSQYRNGDYQAAIRQYSQSLLLAETDDERARALYNLGNSYFKTGDYTNAVFAYRDTLRYRPGHTAARANLDFTAELQRIIEQRHAASGRSKRMGAGARSNRAEPGVDTNEAGAVSIDESDDTDKPDEIIQAIPGHDQAGIENLVEKGMEHIRLAADNAADVQDSSRRKQEMSLSTARLHMQTLGDQQADLWKRVFEMEQGFPGSLKKPQQLRGVSPW